LHGVLYLKLSSHPDRGGADEYAILLYRSSSWPYSIDSLHHPDAPPPHSPEDSSSSSFPIAEETALGVRPTGCAKKKDLQDKKTNDMSARRLGIAAAAKKRVTPGIHVDRRTKTVNAFALPVESSVYTGFLP
jgi:hypothetical protein